jgi:ADP-heptose:LPS heptosyltransferase
VLKLLGIDLKDSHLELWPSKSDEEYIEKLLNTQWLSQEQRVIGINISASKRWATKCWPKEYIIKLCDELGLRNMRVVITGTEDDLPAANMLVNTAKNTKIINACGKTTVNQLAALIKRCAVYISADSSPLHIAAAVNTPVIAFFGPTDPLRHMPPAKDYLLIRKELSCSPCYKAKCKHNKCMNSITVEEVIRGIKKFLK